MENNTKSISKKKKIENAVILTFCIVISACTAYVLLFSYKPDANALRALGTVCLDVICMAMMLIMLISFTFEKNESNHTTKLFHGLLIATMWALFMDFLNWAFDGSFVPGDWRILFTILSLCMGAVLAGIFVIYLSFYFHDMYGMKGQITDVKICVVLNIISFVITLTLGLSGYAFEIVDGHYRVGDLYEIITVLPVLTLIYMTAYAIRHVKIIGIHDVMAVSGYIFTMICGALVESSYGIGITYVSVCIANVYIFIMLQNKYIDRVRKQREELAEKITSQYEILESMSRIYSHVNYLDLEEKVVRRFKNLDGVAEHIDFANKPHSNLNELLYKDIDEKHREAFWAYTDLTTLSERMKNERAISAEFYHRRDGWFRAQYIRIGDSVDEPALKIIYAIRNINEEKKNIEKWIRRSNTDELTGFLNRHAYENDIAALSEEKIKDNFVYVSIDVNSLKIVNDSNGHDAGDELIVGAADCMKQCYGSYGKLYRIGGDEFAALIYADNNQLEDIKKDIEEITENWRGILIKNLAISCGYVTRKEAPDMTLHEMAVLADKRMYEDKNRYYQSRGIDRRGQRDAHIALCALYTKILKINITEDSYHIITMDYDERTSEKGFSDKISEWLRNFGTSGQVHPEDLEDYLSKTSLQYMSEYFKNNKSSLTIIYRRMYAEGYKQAMMEIIPANDYTDEQQSLFLYVKSM